MHFLVFLLFLILFGVGLLFFYSAELFVRKRNSASPKNGRIVPLAWERNRSEGKNYTHKKLEKIFEANWTESCPHCSGSSFIACAEADMNVTNVVFYNAEHVHAQVSDCSATNAIRAKSWGVYFVLCGNTLTPIPLTMNSFDE